MDRLRRVQSGSPEAAQVRAYLQWIWSLRRIAGQREADLLTVEKMLAAEHPRPRRPRTASSSTSPSAASSPTCPARRSASSAAGTGKSSLGAIIAKALDRPFVRLTVSGSNGAAELVGEARTIPGAQPGKDRARCAKPAPATPVIMIDGIDRLAGLGGLGVAEALLELLDRRSSRQFTDHYLGLSIDLSHAILVLCANHPRARADILGDRIEVIEVPGYSGTKIAIAKRFPRAAPAERPRHGAARPRAARRRPARRGAALDARRPACVDCRARSRACAARWRARADQRPRGRVTSHTLGTTSAARCTRPRWSARTTGRRRGGPRVDRAGGGS